MHGETGGTGLAGLWSAAPPAAAVSSDDGVSLPYPLTSPALGAGSRLVISDAVLERSLASGFALSELNTYFFSVLVKKPDGASVRFDFIDGAGNIRWRAGLDAQQRVIAGVVTDTTGAPSASLTDAPVLLVSMLAARPGSAADAARSIVFGMDSALPARVLDLPAFDAGIEQLTQVTLTKLRVTVTGGPVEIDELRIGPTLASVATLATETGACPAPPDFVDDDVLDLRDAAAFLAGFEAGAAAADVNGDGATDLRDYAAFTVQFSEGCR